MSRASAGTTQQALVGIPKTLAAIKRIAESTTDAEEPALS